jgi:hypothetical protein
MRGTIAFRRGRRFPCSPGVVRHLGIKSRFASQRSIAHVLKSNQSRVSYVLVSSTPFLSSLSLSLSLRPSSHQPPTASARPCARVCARLCAEGRGVGTCTPASATDEPFHFPLFSFSFIRLPAKPARVPASLIGITSTSCTRADRLLPCHTLRLSFAINCINQSERVRRFNNIRYNSSRPT